MGYGFDETVTGIITVAWIKWKSKEPLLTGISRQNIFLGRIFFQFLTSSKYLFFGNEIIYLLYFLKGFKFLFHKTTILTTLNKQNCFYIHLQ